MTGNGVQPPHRQMADDDASAPDGAGARPTDESSPPHPLRDFTTDLQEVIEYANLFVTARKDMIRASLRSLVWKAALGAVAGIAGATIIIVATIYLLNGVAD